MDRHDLPDEVCAAAEAAAAKNATDVVVLSVAAVSTVGSFFVICSAASDRQVRAITSAVEHAIDEAAGAKPISIEGADSLEWVLMNYGDLLGHVFQQDSRDFYSLERLWADAPSLRWNDLPDALDSSRD
jgi:ribosome-associated protein